jgi:NitT/TauT family transport system ATP-binding protein
MIEIKNLTFAYTGQPPIFEGFNWKVARGEAWSVIGPSGCGKTTLLYLLAGLRRPRSGEISIDGSLITRPRPRSGLVLQDHGLLPWSTVRQNARLGLTIWEFYGNDGKHAPTDCSLNSQQADRRVDYWLEKLGIGSLQNQYPAKLSRGQRQRTAIARTLVTEPDLLMLDEPFSALDAPTRDELENEVIGLRREMNLTYIIVTHDIEVAVTMGRKILVLQAGLNRNPNILANDCAGLMDSRNQAAFHEKCEQVRHVLGA